LLGALEQEQGKEGGAAAGGGGRYSVIVGERKKRNGVRCDCVDVCGESQSERRKETFP
jgi:hypothetical protein